MRDRPAVKSSASGRAAYSAARIGARVAALGREISRAYKGRRVDVVVTLDGGHARREVYFGARPELKGRDVLLLDAVLESGVTQEFLLRRLGESQPRSLRLAVLLDKPARRRVGLEPDYFGFRTASNEVWVGYGLAADNGTGRNHRALSNGPAQVKRRQGSKK